MTSPNRETPDLRLGIVLEGGAPGSDRPSWMAMVVAAAIAALAGVWLGYGIGAAPSLAPVPASATASVQPSASPSRTPLARPFIPQPCRLVPRLPAVPAAPGQMTSASEGSPLPGMADCTFRDHNGRVVATISLRRAPTTAGELSVIVDEVFHGEGVNATPVGGQRAYFVACAHAWAPCRAALTVIREPYLLVISLGPGMGGLDVVSTLAQEMLVSLPQ